MPNWKGKKKKTLLLTQRKKRVEGKLSVKGLATKQTLFSRRKMTEASSSSVTPAPEITIVHTIQHLPFSPEASTACVSYLAVSAQHGESPGSSADSRLWVTSSCASASRIQTRCHSQATFHNMASHSIKRLKWLSSLFPIPLQILSRQSWPDMIK